MPSQRGYYEFMGYSSEVLRERYAMYAARFAPGSLVGDIGCGRGEFLELLRARGVEGVGVDPDPDMAAEVRGKGFEMVEADGVDFLRQRPASLDGVFAAHLVEHLAAGRVEAFIGAAAQALRPGGRLILVTPNPRNLEVQLREFWVDLQHVRFYTPETLRWILHNAGLTQLEAGENSTYAAGPPEMRRSFTKLAPEPVDAHDGRRRRSAVQRARAAASQWLQPRAAEERLLELEQRMDRVLSWIHYLYPPGEFYVSGVRGEGGPAQAPVE